MEVKTSREIETTSEGATSPFVTCIKDDSELDLSLRPFIKVTPDFSRDKVTLPDVTHLFREAPRPVLMPESFLLELLYTASNKTLQVKTRYVTRFRTKHTRQRAKTDLLLMFFANRAPIGYLQDFLFELYQYSGTDEEMLRLREALFELLKEDEEDPGRLVGSGFYLAEALRKGEKDLSIVQEWTTPFCLISEYFLAPALLWRLRREGLLTEQDEATLKILGKAGRVDPRTNDLLTQYVRLRTVPWREEHRVVRYLPEGGKETSSYPVLDLVIDLLWSPLSPEHSSLSRFAREGESPEDLRLRLKSLLRDVASMDIMSAHVLNPGFIHYKPRKINLALVRAVGRDGVNSLILVTFKGDQALRRSLVPTCIHPSIRELRQYPLNHQPRSIEEPPARWANLEDARLDLFKDYDGHYKIYLTYTVAGDDLIPILETTTVDAERLLSYLEEVPSKEILQPLPEELWERIEAKHARVIFETFESQEELSSPTPPSHHSLFITDPVHPLLIPENREMLLKWGLPPEVYTDPRATVKDASRMRQKILFGNEIREVDLWEFRSKKGGHHFLNAPLYRGRYQNPDPSWIGRVALDPRTLRIVAIPLMYDGEQWRFKPYLISEDRFAWIGGSSQRGVEEMEVENPVTGKKEILLVAMNVIHTTQRVNPEELPRWLQPTEPNPQVPLWKYELRLTLELNPLDPFAEPVLYEGVASTPWRIDDWVGWVGRVKFNNNFSVVCLEERHPTPAGRHRRVFEFLMGGGDHVIQHAWCDFERLTPLSLHWDEQGNLLLPPFTPFVNPQTGEMYHLPEESNG